MTFEPEPPPSFDFPDPTAITQAARLVLDNTKALNDRIAETVYESTATFETVVRPIIDDANLAACSLRTLGSLLASVSPDAVVRNASREVDKLVVAADEANLMRRDVAVLVVAAFERECERKLAGASRLDRQDWHLLNHMHALYKRSGAAIQDEAKISQIVAMRAELKDLCLAAVKTITDAKDGISFTHDELEGLSADALADLKSKVDANDDGIAQKEYWISWNTSPPILRDAIRPATRRKCYVASERRFAQNLPRLQRIMELKHEVATMLGYTNHVEMKMADKMARGVSEVQSSLLEIQKKLQPLRDAEIAQLLELKLRHEVNAENVLYAWDWPFYARILREESHNLDRSKLKEYFEANNTLQEMLSLFAKLFGMRFEKIATSVWHDDVNSYSVWDAASEGGGFLGYLYTDIFARDGKHRNAGHFLIKPGFTEANGTRHYPVSALSCSFDAPTKGKPRLLTHTEVTLMFHELGHAIHRLVARTKYAIPHSRDYVEIPSLMLEHWTWNADVLTTIGRHYTTLDTNRTTQKEKYADGQLDGRMPRSLAESVTRTKALHGAHQMMILVQRALFDLAIHSPADRESAIAMDTTALWNKTRSEIVGLALSDVAGEESLAHAGFGHIFRKYDAGFFAYALSTIWAADIYAHGFAKQPLDEAAGRRYRYMVLELGSSVPEIEILEGFLGRKHSSEAFYSSLVA